MSSYSYHGALEAAGAEVLAFEEFGSYQGNWWAKVMYQGQIGWVKGSYGSCSGCDAIQAEFDNDDRCKRHRYEHPRPENCPDCEATAAEAQVRYIAMGKDYLEPLWSQEEAEKEASRDIEWDSDAADALAFIKKEAIK